MDEFIDIHDVPKLNQDEVNNLSNLIISSELEEVMENLPN